MSNTVKLIAILENTIKALDSGDRSLMRVARFRTGGYGYVSDLLRFGLNGEHKEAASIARKKLDEIKAECRSS